jgi:uroporphyrin-III C-methyltransferase/precorrin-2 dehydrogenase/sirohydrochlorin ferrochelatase
MSLTGLDLLCRELVRHGMPAETPAALVERGTLPAQRVLVAPLTELPARVDEARVSAPTLVIIGEVVTLRDRLDWFES